MEGLTKKQVTDAVSECNNALHNIKDNVNELNVDNIQQKVNELARVWTTDNGVSTIAGLNNSLNQLRDELKDLKEKRRKIKGRNYRVTFSEEVVMDP